MGLRGLGRGSLGWGFEVEGVSSGGLGSEKLVSGKLGLRE